jgi:hypothetical protein
VHALLLSQPWDTANVGGEEVDIEPLRLPIAAK